MAAASAAFGRGDLGAPGSVLRAGHRLAIAGTGPLAGDYEGSAQVMGLLGKISELSAGRSGELRDVLVGPDAVAFTTIRAERSAKQLQLDLVQSSTPKMARRPGLANPPIPPPQPSSGHSAQLRRPGLALTRGPACPLTPWLCRPPAAPGSSFMPAAVGEVAYPREPKPGPPSRTPAHQHMPARPGSPTAHPVPEQPEAPGATSMTFPRKRFVHDFTSRFRRHVRSCRCAVVERSGLSYRLR